MEALHRYSPERRASIFIAELKELSQRAATNDTEAQGLLLGMFCQPFQDTPSMLSQIGEEAERHFKPDERTAVQMGKYLMGRFNSNFGFESNAWGEGGLTHENPHLKKYFAESAAVINGFLSEYGIYGNKIPESLINAHTAFQDLLDHVQAQLARQPVA